MLSPAASLQSAIPLQKRPSRPVYAVPESFHIPLVDIDSPDKLPRFLLLGERDDASFEPTDEGFNVEYVWPAFSTGPVCRLEVDGEKQIQVMELWNGEKVFHSFGHGDTLTDALNYHYGATLALRDAQRVFPDQHVVPAQLDPREPFFRGWFTREFGINWRLPVPGVRLNVQQPAGILRALVLPCSDSLDELIRQYREQPDAYSVDLDDRLRHGIFTHRSADVRWHRLDEDRRHVEHTECRIFVGAWRAVVELAQFLHKHRSLTGGRLHPFACFPHNLVRPVRMQQGRKGERDSIVAEYPPLLPPQVGIGMTEGLTPESLGDLSPFRAGGPEEKQRILRQAIDRAFPVGGDSTLFVLSNPAAPVISLQRSAEDQATVPVLCVLPEDPDAMYKVAEIVCDASGERVKLGHVAKGGQQKFFIAPNLPDDTYCHDPEGFHYLLHDVVRQLETELDAGWIVEDFVLSGSQDGKELTSSRAAGSRQEGW